MSRRVSYDSLNSVLHIDIWSFLPNNCLIEIVGIITPPGWIYQRIETWRARFHCRVSIAHLGWDQIHAMSWRVVWCLTSSPIRRRFCHNEASLTSTSWENLDISNRRLFCVKSFILHRLLCGWTLCCRVSWHIWLSLRCELDTASSYPCRWVRMSLLLQACLLLLFFCQPSLLLLFLLPFL